MFELCTNSSDPIISSIAPHLDAIKEPGSKTPIESGIDFSGVKSLIQSSNIFQYSGSLTTPPCSEGVTFLAVETPLKINVPDYNAIKKIVKYNSRLSQNSLGQENIIAVAAASGAIAGGNETIVQEEKATPAAGAPAPGSHVEVSEISGSPVAEPLVGVVQRGMRFRH